MYEKINTKGYCSKKTMVRRNNNFNKKDIQFHKKKFNNVKVGHNKKDPILSHSERIQFEICESYADDKEDLISSIEYMIDAYFKNDKTSTFSLLYEKVKVVLICKANPNGNIPCSCNVTFFNQKKCDCVYGHVLHYLYVRMIKNSQNKTLKENILSLIDLLLENGSLPEKGILFDCIELDDVEMFQKCLHYVKDINQIQDCNKNSTVIRSLKNNRYTPLTFLLTDYKYKTKFYDMLLLLLQNKCDYKIGLYHNGYTYSSIWNFILQKNIITNDQFEHIKTTYEDIKTNTNEIPLSVTPHKEILKDLITDSEFNLKMFYLENKSQIIKMSESDLHSFLVMRVPNKNTK